jgi:hypothetical protein
VKASWNQVLTRRSVLAALAAPLSGAGIRLEVFLRSPAKGVAVMAAAYYTKASGGDLVSIEEHWSRSDTIDVAYYRRSRDNGRTWSAPVRRATGERRPEGMLRRHLRGVWVDPGTGRAIEFWNEGVLPTDDPLEGLREWGIFYSVDGGAPRQLIHRGTQFDAYHPLPGVWRGRSAVMLGDKPSLPLAMRDGAILLPVQLTLPGPDGKLVNPGGGYTWTESAVLLGKWRRGTLEWEMGGIVRGDPTRTTRGMVEPTVAELRGGRLLMVLRGSNDRKPELPSYRWASFSEDEGRTWTAPAPWTYTSGEMFFSPSACSQLLTHSSGRLYWLGNITPLNPRGNRPRYPFVIGEVDRESGLLVRESIRTVDDKAPEDDAVLTLSNFYAREDRATREIVLHMTRLFAFNDGWQGDAMLYRIPATAGKPVSL